MIYMRFMFKPMDKRPVPLQEIYARLVTLPFLQWLALAASVAAVLLGAASMAPALRRTLFGSGPLGHD